MNKRWVKEDGGYTLYFTPYDDEIELARIWVGKDGEWVCRSSEALDGSMGWLFVLNLDEAKEEAERWVEEYYEDQHNYYQELLDKFTEKPPVPAGTDTGEKEIISLVNYNKTKKGCQDDRI